MLQCLISTKVSADAENNLSLTLAWGFPPLSDVENEGNHDFHLCITSEYSSNGAGVHSLHGLLSIYTILGND